MDILQQCQKWNENDEYQKIIDALEAIPAKERTPAMRIRRSSSNGVRKAFPCLNFQSASGNGRRLRGRILPGRKRSFAR